MDIIEAFATKNKCYQAVRQMCEMAADEVVSAN